MVSIMAKQRQRVSVARAITLEPKFIVEEVNEGHLIAYHLPEVT